MPVEKTKNYIRIRLKNPNKYKKFAVKELGQGVKGVIGIKSKKGPMGGKSELQSVMVPKGKKKLAEEWKRKAKVR